MVHKFLDCGNLERGFARIRCDHCEHEYLDFHPHVHALVADGLFLRNPPDSPAPPPPTPASSLQPAACPVFLPLPETSLKPLEELFRAKVIKLLVEEELLPVERVQDSSPAWPFEALQARPFRAKIGKSCRLACRQVFGMMGSC